MIQADPRYATLPASVLRQAAEVLSVLGHPVRLRIIELLIGGELTVGQLAASIRANPSLTSGHLKTMRAARIVTRRREGRFIYYRLSNPHAAATLNALRRLHLQRYTFEDGEAI